MAMKVFSRSYVFAEQEDLTEDEDEEESGRWNWDDDTRPALLASSSSSSSRGDAWRMSCLTCPSSSTPSYIPAKPLDICINVSEETLTLESVLSEPLAPRLPPGRYYHLFLIHHPSDSQWAHGFIDRLEMPAFGFRCCCVDRDVPERLPRDDVLHYGAQLACKVIVLVTVTLVEAWSQASQNQQPLFPHLDLSALLQTASRCDVVTLLTTDAAAVPASLHHLPSVNVHASDNWWLHVLEMLQQRPASTSVPGESLLKVKDTSQCRENPVTDLHRHHDNNNCCVSSGQLLLSVRSFCGRCCREIVDVALVTEHLQACGVKVTGEELCRAFGDLFSDARFACHSCCYSVPVASVTFVLLLILCISAVPLLESHLVYNHRQTGLEFVHGGLVWLCLLTVYLSAVHVTRRQLRASVDKKMRMLNTVLLRHNVFVGLEDLSVAFSNKFLLHFLYFDFGPCLEYLQELLSKIDDYSSGSRAKVTRSIQMSTNGDVRYDSRQSLYDHSLTCLVLQSKAEELLSRRASDYVKMFIKKELGKPSSIRHCRDVPCPCQFAESSQQSTSSSTIVT